MRQADGNTLLSHLQVAAAAGQVDPILEEDLVPSPCRELYKVFLQLTRTKDTSLGVSAFTFREVLAWCDLYGVRLSVWELDTLMDMDAAAQRVAVNSRSK